MTEQEVKPCEFANGACIHCEATDRGECEGWVCPPKRPWVDLTDEEMSECNLDADELMISREVAKLNVQAKLKEKNT